MLKLELSYRGLLTLAFGFLALWMLVQLWTVLLLIVVALIFTAALLPYVEWLVRHGSHRISAVLLVLVAIIGVLGGLAALVVPAMINEFRDLRDNLPEDARQFEEFAEDLGINTASWDLPERAEEIEWGKLISGDVAVDYGQRVVFGLVSSVTVIVLVAYLLIDAPKISGYMYRFVPPGREPEVDTILAALGRVVGGYIRGQLITSTVIGVFTLVVCLLAGVDNAIAFGVLAAFADIIPLIGAFIAIIPPVVAAFQESPQQALIVLGALLVYQQFEDRFLVPRVYGQTLNLPPLIVLIAVLAGGELLGIPGILLALPATAAGRVLLEYWLDRRQGIPFKGIAGSETEVAAPDPAPQPSGGE
ncbi:MAG: AI-2E family transporter [Dehalococcoidia bacterium]|nr:AI-2E family transporter [Dehalococcoidia bacterium]